MRDYVEKLLRRGEMRVVEREVDPRFELAAVVERSQADSSKPILFRKVKGTALPVVSNLFGSNARICEILGTPPGRLCQRWAELMQRVAAMGPDHTRVVHESAGLVSGRIGDLPRITWREKDLGPYITAGVFLAKDPQTGVPNLSFCRTFMKSDRELVCDIAPPHDLAQYQAKAEANGEPLEIAILIAPPPEIFVAACASVPIDVDEMKIASAIRGRPLEVRACETVALEVPVDTQVVIEGSIRPGVRATEGPFGEFMGYYGPVNPNGYVIDVRRVSWRPDAIFHGLLCGTAEDLAALDVGFATRTYSALASVPGILDVACNPMFYCTVVKIDKRYEGQARQVMLKVFAANLNYNFVCIVVDKDIDPRDLREVFSAYLTRGRVDRRTWVLEDVPGWDHSTNPTLGGRVGIDATTPLGREAEYERARTPGSDTLRLADYLPL
ncbi:MAG TPA: UbiD family decarboxylase [Steroidobacteraceae bacterium]|nr:UbiD family decarboxylase [Steroidobacteraceae bacterium]